MRDGAGWVGKVSGKNWSEALGLGCWDKSGIGAVAATFLFRGCQRKKRGSGAVARLPRVAEGKAEVTGSSAEDWKCRERHKGATGQKRSAGR